MNHGIRIGIDPLMIVLLFPHRQIRIDSRRAFCPTAQILISFLKASARSEKSVPKKTGIGDTLRVLQFAELRLTHLERLLSEILTYSCIFCISAFSRLHRHQTFPASSRSGDFVHIAFPFPPVRADPAHFIIRILINCPQNHQDPA